MAAAKVQWEAHDTQRICVQRESRFLKLCGRPKVYDWEADMDSHLKASPILDREGLNLILDHLSGAAGQEVRFREPRTAEKDPRIVRRVSGDVNTIGAAQEAFDTRISQTRL